MPAEPKIRLFLWRSLSGALVVADSCGIWAATTLPTPPQGFSGSVAENVSFLLDQMDKTELAEGVKQAIPWFLWEIWKARNSTLFANRIQDAHVIVATTLEESEEWLKQQRLITQELIRGTTREPHTVHRWIKPPLGKLKCNIHAAWTNESSYSGGAWILRNHTGDVLYHARDAFLPRSNRIAAKLNCLLWCLQSLIDLHIMAFEVWTDCHAVVSAIASPLHWPRYRSVLDKIKVVVRVMGEFFIKLCSPKANSLARAIASSVTRDERLTSYLALGGPAWLHNQIEADR